MGSQNASAPRAAACRGFCLAKKRRRSDFPRCVAATQIVCPVYTELSAGLLLDVRFSPPFASRTSSHRRSHEASLCLPETQIKVHTFELVGMRNHSGGRCLRFSALLTVAARSLLASGPGSPTRAKPGPITKRWNLFLPRGIECFSQQASEQGPGLQRTSRCSFRSLSSRFSCT